MVKRWDLETDLDPTPRFMVDAGDYDALAAAARKAMQFHDKEDCQCVYCADLRALLGEK